MHFSPSLGVATTLCVPLAPNLPTIYFTCQDPQFPPQVWTNLASADSLDWRAVPFTESTSQPGFWTAQVPVSQLGEGIHDFEYTYRLARSDNGGFDWLADTRGNGRITIRIGGKARGESVKAKLHTFELEQDSENQLFDLSELEEIRNFVEAGASQGFVLERSERPWYIPRLLPSPTPLASLSPDFVAQLVLLRSEAAGTLIIFPFSTSLVASSLVGSSSSTSLNLHCTRDSKSKDAGGSVVVGLAKDGQLRELIDKCVEVAREALGGVALGVSENENAPLGLTWCTWNALGPDYTLSQVLSSLSKFGLTPSSQTSASLPIFTRAIDAVLLDDGWQDVKPFDDPFEEGVQRRGLWSFGVKEGWMDVHAEVGEEVEINAKGEGWKRRRQDSGFYSETNAEMEMQESQEELQEAVRKIKDLGVENVGVWMTLGKLYFAQVFGRAVADSEPCSWVQDDALPSADTTFFLPDPSSLSAYYTAYFSFLKSAGISFVKIDDQAHLDFIKSSFSTSKPVDIGLLRTTMLSAMQSAARKVFASSDRIVHCMAGSPRIFGGPLALTSSAPSIVRNSDDYFPDRPDSHRYHIFLNSYTSLLTRSVAFLPDFDMCQEQHPYGPFHIAFRCRRFLLSLPSVNADYLGWIRAFSPAPTLATDAPGEVSITDEKGWKMLLAPSALGGIRVLKTQGETGAILEGRIGEDVVGGFEGPALKLGMSVPGAGALLGLWNCRADEHASSDVLDTRDIVDALTSGSGSVVERKDVVVYFGQSGKAYTVSGAELVEATGAPHIAAKPITAAPLSAREVLIATIAPFHTLPTTFTSTEEPLSSLVQIACVGLLGKYAGLSAIASISVVDRTSSPPLPISGSNSSRSTSSSLSRQSSTQRLRESFSASRSRLSFLLAYLLGSRKVHDQRTFGTEASNFAREFFTRPAKTVYNEVGALVGLIGAALAWTVTRISTRTPPESIEPPKLFSKQKDEGTKSELAGSSNKVLRVQLAFAGRVGFYASSGGAPLTFEIDGRRIGKDFVKRPHRNEAGMVEVDLEGFLGVKAEKGAEGGRGWVIDVAC
ncbi:hypothetical protein P7C70_g307, partial [Phenoliferia sp. Uapishka_3]